MSTACIWSACWGTMDDVFTLWPAVSFYDIQYYGTAVLLSTGNKRTCATSLALGRTTGPTAPSYPWAATFTSAASPTHT